MSRYRYGIEDPLQQEPPNEFVRELESGRRAVALATVLLLGGAAFIMGFALYVCNN